MSIGKMKNAQEIFSSSWCKKGNFNKPIATGFLKFDSNSHQAAMFTDPGCSAA